MTALFETPQRAIRFTALGQVEVVQVAPPGPPVPREAVLAPLAVGIHAVRRAGGRLDDVLIVGAGVIGLSVLLAARLAGARRVVVIDPVPTKRRLALELGADAAHDVDDPLERRHTAVFDCVAARTTLRRGVDLVCGGGVVVVVGVPRADDEWSWPLSRTQRYEIDLVGSGMYTRADLEQALAAAASGKMDPAVLRSATVPFDEAARAYQLAADPDTLKVVVSLR
jgi:2-desacetyl-2-hydroxyethyl bacteriochlorophyllide A dehydrogenase